MDEVEKRITKNHEMEKRRNLAKENYHEYNTLGHYRQAMIQDYKKTEKAQEENRDPYS